MFNIWLNVTWLDMFSGGMERREFEKWSARLKTSSHETWPWKRSHNMDLICIYQFKFSKKWPPTFVLSKHIKKILGCLRTFLTVNKNITFYMFNTTKLKRNQRNIFSFHSCSQWNIFCKLWLTKTWETTNLILLEFESFGLSPNLSSG